MCLPLLTRFIFFFLPFCPILFFFKLPTEQHRALQLFCERVILILNSGNWKYFQSVINCVKRVIRMISRLVSQRWQSKSRRCSSQLSNHGKIRLTQSRTRKKNNKSIELRRSLWILWIKQLLNNIHLLCLINYRSFVRHCRLFCNFSCEVMFAANQHDLQVESFLSLEVCS